MRRNIGRADLSVYRCGRARLLQEALTSALQATRPHVTEDDLDAQTVCESWGDVDARNNRLEEFVSLHRRGVSETYVGSNREEMPVHWMHGAPRNYSDPS